MTDRNVEKKRKKEQYVVEEMIRLYCRKTTENMTGRQVGCVRPAGNSPNTPGSAVRNVLLWKKRRSAATVECTAINRRCGRRSGR